MQRNERPRDRNRGSQRALLLGFLTLVVLANLLVLQSPWFKGPKRYLIIHSDDAGMYASVNGATIDALEHGLVSSCSILVPCPAFEEFAKYAATHPEKDFGVHLALNCDTSSHRWGPVLPREQVPSLVDSSGHLWRHAEETAQHVKIEEAELELRAQIEKARAAGIAISHLNHHMFVLYYRPDLLRLYIKLGFEYHLPLRYEQTVRLGEFGVSDPNCTTAYREGLETLRHSKLPILGGFEANNYDVPPNQKRAYFQNVLAQLKPGVTELIIHCAEDIPDQPLAPHIARRSADTQVFRSEEIKKFVRQEGVQIITWRQFAKM